VPRNTEVKFTISARDKASRALDRVREKVRGIGRAMRRIGASAVAAGAGFAALAKSALEFGAKFQAAANRVNASAETLQGLKVLGDDIGASFDTTVSVMQRLQSNAGAAIRGNQGLIDSFEALGIAVSELEGMDGEALFLRVADATANFSGDAKVLQDTLRKIGDTEIVRLIPLLEQGATSIKEQIKGLKEAGAILSNERTLEAAKKEAAIRREILALQVQLNDSVLAVLPALIKAATVLAKLVDKAGEFLGTTAAKGVIAAQPVVAKVAELRGRAGVDGGASRQRSIDVLGALNPEIRPGLSGASPDQQTAILAEINKNIQDQTRRLERGGTLR